MVAAPNLNLGLPYMMTLASIPFVSQETDKGDISSRESPRLRYERGLDS